MSVTCDDVCHVFRDLNRPRDRAARLRARHEAVRPPGAETIANNQRVRGITGGDDWSRWLGSVKVLNDGTFIGVTKDGGRSDSLLVIDLTRAWDRCSSLFVIPMKIEIQQRAAAADHSEKVRCAGILVYPAHESGRCGSGRGLAKL